MEHAESLAHDSDQPEESKKPVMGILSFVFALIPIAFCLFIISLLLSNSQVLVGFDISIFPIVWLIFSVPGLVFGIVGAFQKNKKKAISIIGIVLNSLILLFALLGAVFVLFVLAFSQ